MFFELRQYRIFPGQRDAWVKYMEEVIMPFQISKGMVIVGSFVGQQEDDLYIWIRRFESEEERERLYKAVYETDTWKNEIGSQGRRDAGSLAHRGDAHRGDAEVGDPIAWPQIGAAERLFEQAEFISRRGAKNAKEQ